MADEDDDTPINEDLTPVEEIVTLGGREYMLREVSGANGTIYENVTNDAVIWVDGKYAGTKDMARTELMLVGMCLFTIDHEKPALHDKPVGETTIGKWPARIKRKLFKRAEKISGLSNVVETKESLLARRAKIDEKLKYLEEHGEESKNG